MGRLRKGFYLTLDATLAVALIITAVVLVSQVQTSATPAIASQRSSEDVVQSLNSLTLGEMEPFFPVITSIINDTSLTENDSVLFGIGLLWAINDSRAANLSQVIDDVLPNSTSVRLLSEGTLLYEKNGSVTGAVQSVAKQQITGIAQNQPLSGSSSSAQLKKIRNKRTNQFVTFGGFVGQGNITSMIQDFPSDANITSIWLQADMPDNFSVYFNNNFCASFDAETGDFVAESQNLTMCIPFLDVNSSNDMEIRFDSTINTAYVAGGVVRFEYTTEEIIGTLSLTDTNQSIHGIDGIINLFDSILIPGTLQNLTVFLHYEVNRSITDVENNTLFLMIGNQTVYTDRNRTGAQQVTLTDLNFSALNFTWWSNSTVPFRLGFENLSFTTFYSGNSDIVFVTDVSGSMDWRMDYTGTSSCGGCPGNPCCGVDRACNDPLINATDTQRLALAVCLEGDFFTSMLNFSDNLIGLASYESSLDSTWPLTTNRTDLDNEISTYNAGGGTCICCGINGAVNILDVGTTSLIAPGSVWDYYTLDSVPPVDGSSNAWYQNAYSLTGPWSFGSAILGATNGDVYTPTVSTEIALGGSSSVFAVDLWDMAVDQPAPVDFGNGFNSTANTYGAGAGNDGWDWDWSPFVTSNRNMTELREPSGIINGLPHDSSTRLQVELDGDQCTGCGYRDSAGFGIEFNITDAMWAVLNTPGGVAQVSFDYEAFDTEQFGSGSGGTEESCWIKARFSNTTDSTYLGYDLDSGYPSSRNPDASNEILFDYTTSNSVRWHTDSNRGDFDMDGDGDRNAGTHTEDVRSLIGGPGIHYLELGAKFDGTNNWQVVDEGIRAYFDNIQLVIYNETQTFYYRYEFGVNSSDQAVQAFMNILVDDRAAIYVNDVLVYNQSPGIPAEYWDERGFFINNTLLQVGANTVAAEVQNIGNASKFDLELIGINDTKNSAIFVMTDGEATQSCGGGSAMQDAIDAACTAREDYGITTYAVGFSSGANEPTLSAIADCGGGIYRKSDNASELQDFYDDVAFDILIAGRRNQVVELTNGSQSVSTLHPDSYIHAEYTQPVSGAQAGDIAVTLQSDVLTACTDLFEVVPGARVAKASVTSFSGSEWTHFVSVNGNEVFNLSEHGSQYELLGDPFLVDLPANLFVTGNNTIQVDINGAPGIANNCSLNNSVLYTLLFQGGTSRSTVVEFAEGCEWTVEYEDLTFDTLRVPTTYNGTNRCSYTNTNRTLADSAYNPNDAYDIAVNSLMRQLDFDDDGRVFVNLDENDIEIVVNTVSSIPYLWGPSVVEVQVEQ